METTLVALWRSAKEFVTEKSCAQVVSMAGDGTLRDGNDTSYQFREFLAQVPGDQIRIYADECLTQRFDNAPYALQDIVNETGSRVGFKVEAGRYRGVRNQVGFDGIWRSSDGFSILLEVKTSDAFRINLDTIANYRQTLIREGRISEQESSILLAVGREDTGDLEAQIRGSRHAWDIRVISIDALLRLMNIKEQMSDWGTSSSINALLRPLEFTRVDGIVELLFATAKDLDEPSIENDRSEDDSAPPEITKKGPQEFDHESARSAVIEMAASHFDKSFKKKGRVFWSSTDGTVNLICLSSQPYGENLQARYFWYGFKPGQKAFLDEAENSYILFACGHDVDPVLFDRSSFLKIVEQLKTSPPSPTDDSPLVHWHVTIYHDGKRAEISTPLIGERTDVSSFILKPV